MRLQNRFGRHSWLALPVLALLVRLVPAIILPVGAGFDIESFKLTAEALLSGKDVYTSAAIGRHPYLPFQMYSIGLAMFASRSTGLPFVVLVKFSPIAADVVITALIWFIAVKKGWSQVTAWWLALLYALNPVAILITAYHGQFDSIPVLLLLIAWYFWHFGQRMFLSSVALGFAILNKTWPIVFLPIILIRLRRFRPVLTYSLVAIGLPILFTLAYVVTFSSNPEPMLRRALTHTGNSGWYGLSAILTLGGRYQDSLAQAAQIHWEIRRWILVIVGILALWRTRKQSSNDALVTIILAEIALTIGLGLQWLLWVVPFAIVSKDIFWLRIYSLAVTIFFLIPHLYGLHMVPWAFTWFEDDVAEILLKVIPLPMWIVVVLWLLSRWRRVNQISFSSID